jgi:hypothetical protein
MLYFILAQLVSLLLDLGALSRRSERHKDLQILLLRQQLRILQRQLPKQPRISRWEKVALAVLAGKFADLSHDVKTRLDQLLLLFKPATV